MTKADIVEIIYEKIGFSRKESAEIVDLVFDLLKETLEVGDKVKISGFGNFNVRAKSSRKGRNLTGHGHKWSQFDVWKGGDFYGSVGYQPTSSGHNV